MDELYEPTVFSRFNRSLRGVLIDNQPWLVARDLGYLIDQPVEQYTARRLDDDLRRQARLATATGEETPWLVSDFGLFYILNRYRDPEHRPLRQWLTGQVLPILRDQATRLAARPRRLLVRGEGRAMAVLDWQGELWAPLNDMPRLLREERQRRWWRNA